MKETARGREKRREREREKERERKRDRSEANSSSNACAQATATSLSSSTAFAHSSPPSHAPPPSHTLSCHAPSPFHRYDREIEGLKELLEKERVQREEMASFLVNGAAERSNRRGRPPRSRASLGASSRGVAGSGRVAGGGSGRLLRQRMLVPPRGCR